MLVSVLVGAFAAAAILDLYLRKKFNIEKNEKFSDQFFSKGHMIFEILLCIVFFNNYFCKRDYRKAIVHFIVFIFCYIIRNSSITRKIAGA